MSSYDLPRMVEDIGAARRWIADRGLAARPGLLGISFGGVGAYAAAARDQAWGALALVAAPMGPLEASSLYLESRGLPGSWRRAMLRSVGRVLSLDGQDFRGAACLAKIAAPVLIVHGTQDRVVPVSHAEALASAGQAGERDVHLVEGGGHELADDPTTGRLVAAFFERALAT